MPSQSSSGKTYDVFLSFRGGDTRKDFVDHLYSALDQQGIYTYKDDITLPRGETINTSLMEAIQKSHIAIIVFSKNYADSSWCLDELVHIMECKNKRELIVMPIFLDVTPSDVRKQKGDFGEAFAKQVSNNSGNIKSWRVALDEAANLSGWEPDNMANGHQSVGIKQIVSVVSQKLQPVNSNDKEDLIGIETRMEALTSQLQIGVDGVRMVGIWGIGGGGKTTLATSVYNKISREFEGSCFVDNIMKETSTKDLMKLQNKILSTVLKNSFKVPSYEEGRCMVKRRLCHKKVLIVLDDIIDKRQLEALAGSHDWFGDGSRIIITTRDEHLLKAHDVDATYEIRLLDDAEAIQLFQRHALQRCGSIEDYKNRSQLLQDVVYYARGLPLALRVLGLSLCDKSSSEWKSALTRLKEIPEPGIVDVLKISYDGLTPVQQKLFLDIACFFRHVPIDKTLMMLEACDCHPTIGIKELTHKALITTLNGRFDMHDLIQEMGHYIVRGKHPRNPERHSRVWKVEEIEDMCTCNETMENNEIQALYAPYHYAPPNLFKVVSSMKQLRLLNVCQKVNILDKEPMFLSRNLQWISWKHYPASSLPTSFQAKDLVSLILHSGMQKELWHGYKKLPCLKVLDVSHSNNLIKTPDITGLEKLERLVLSGCSSLKDLHSSLGCHKGLVYLNLDGCCKLEKFPPIVRMQNLKTLILSKCSHLHEFPEIHGRMDCLEYLILDHSGIKVLPASIGQYCRNLVSTSLIGCDDLNSIECNFQLFEQNWSFSVGGNA